MQRFEIAVIPDMSSFSHPQEFTVEVPTRKKVLHLITLALLIVGGFLYYVVFTSNPLQWAFVDELKKGNPITLARYHRAVELFQQGQWEDAMDAAAPLYRNNPDNANFLALGAWIQYKLERYPRALELARQAVALEPNRAREHALIGSCYLAGSEIRPAIEHSKAAVKLDPNLGLPYLTLGEILLRQDKNQKAILVLKRGARHDPRSVKAWNLLSSAYLKLNQLDKAIVAGKAALALNPKSAEAHFNLSRAYYKQKDSGPAIRHIQLAEDLYSARGDKNWTAQARQTKEVMIRKFKMRPEDVLQ
jgi:predicted Zn-dependent protease